MYVALYGNDGDPMQMAAARGLRALGHRVELQVPHAFRAEQCLKTVDAAVTCGLEFGCGEAALIHQAQGIPVATIDQPHLPQEGYWRVTPPQLDWLPGQPAVSISPLFVSQIRSQLE